MMTDGGDVEERDEPELIEKTFLTLILEDFFYPVLYRPISKLDSFLWDNRHLFTLIGVFGAVAVYLQTVEDQVGAEMGQLGNTAVVSALLLVLVMSIIVLIKVAITIWRGNIWENVGIVIFGTFFGVLIMAMTGLMSAFQEALSLYYMLIVTSAAIATGWLGIMLLSIAGIRSDKYINRDIPIASGVIFVSATLGISYVITTTNYMAAISEMPTPPLTFGQWIDLYLGFSIALSGLLIYTMFAVYCVIVSIIVIAYLLIGTVRLGRRFRKRLAPNG